MYSPVAADSSLRVSHKLCLAAAPMLTDAVWVHGDGVGDVRENTDGVASVQPVDNSVALEVKAVDVCLRAQSRQVPGYMVPLAHCEARQVSVHKAIDGWNADTETEQGKNIWVVKVNPLKKLLFLQCNAVYSAFCCWS